MSEPLPHTEAADLEGNNGHYQGRRSRYGTAGAVPLFQDNNVLVFILQNLQHATHDSEAGEHIPRLLVYQLQPDFHSHVSRKLYL